MVEYWSPTEPYEAPKGKGLWEYKSRTDLFDFKKAKSTPTSLDFSPDSSRFVTVSTADRQIRIFDFASGKLLRKYDESLQAAHDMHSGKVNESEPSELGGALQQHQVQLDDMEFGRRLALERDLDASAQDAVGNAVRAASGACSANVVFDEEWDFHPLREHARHKDHQYKINEVALILGKDETTRFLNVSLFQGVANRKKAKSIVSYAVHLTLLSRDLPNF
ncbi:hypothetical protein L7F22_029855 [Adiantum nelumboides]|nr:hypothetical protein [Adiantum nelumboides]